MANERQMCPFCPLMVEPKHYEPVGIDLFRQPVKIGDIPCCEPCKMVAMSLHGGDQEMLDWLKDYQAKQPA